MLALKPPVPRPMMIKAMMKTARQASGLVMTPGTAEITSKMWPSKAMKTDTQMVL